MGSQGVSMKLFHNGNPEPHAGDDLKRTGTSTGERMGDQGEEIAPYWKVELF